MKSAEEIEDRLRDLVISVTDETLGNDNESSLLIREELLDAYADLAAVLAECFDDFDIDQTGNDLRCWARRL